MTKMQALQSFWSSFGLEAYDANSVPDDVQLPYLTYEASDDSFGNVLFRNASLWYRSNSWADITKKEQEIADYITRGGRLINYDNGAMWIQKSTPWAQRLADVSDSAIRRVILSVTIEFLD